MLNVIPTLKGLSQVKVLCLGAHCDDIEIGCGATLLKLLQAHDNVVCTWAVLSADEARERECRESAAAFLAGAREQHVIIQRFRDGYMPYVGPEVKDFFERLKSEITPDVVFTHCRDDLHQDHRLISGLTWNTYRNHLVLEYEIPKYDGDLRSPNVFVPVDEDGCRSKIEYLLKHYRTQRSHAWFTESTFRAVMRLRGIESGSPTGYAEGFYGRKMSIQW
jgi:LmbE family N-acetylglucosaminyl deacetylase